MKIYMSKLFFILLLFIPFQCQSQIITTIAGNDSSRFSGDGGPAINARFECPAGITLDGAGNIYIGDIISKRIRKIDTFGIIRTVIGNGTNSCLVENQPATNASFEYIAYMHIYNDTEMYIPDYYCSNLYKVGTFGLVNKIAGTGSLNTSGDGGPATSAAIEAPTSVLVRNKNIYFSDGYARIRMIDSLGIIHTVVGDTPGFSGDGGTATDALLQTPISIAFNSKGELIIGDAYNYRIRKVDTNGIITTICGTGVAGFNAVDMFGFDLDHFPATAAQTNFAEGIVVDDADNIFFVDAYNFRIRKIDTNGLVWKIAGDGISANNGDGGFARNAELGGPEGLALDKQGNLLAVCGGRIRKITNAGVRYNHTAVPATPVVPAVGYSLFPNPNSGTFTLMQQYPDNQPLNIRIWNELGICVYQEECIIIGSKQFQLFKNMPGLYSLEIIDNSGKNYLFKFIVD